jgi:hypothetical protein
MKKRTILLLATVCFFFPLTVLAQHSSKAAETKQVDSKLSKKASLLSGQISLDGKTLVTEKNEIWTVTNPDVLAGHQGQRVLVKCQLFASKNEIQVFSLEPAAKDLKLASNRADSAFRR